MSLLIRGYDTNEIVQVLKMEGRNFGWYKRVEKKAIQEICNAGYRPALARLYHSQIQIPTRTGSTDYSIFLAIVSLAWFFESHGIILASQRAGTCYQLQIKGPLSIPSPGWLNWDCWRKFHLFHI